MKDEVPGPLDAQQAAFAADILASGQRLLARRLAELHGGTLEVESEPGKGSTFTLRLPIFAHNHPSGIAEPSHADQLLTQNLKQALALVNIKVLDHFIIGLDSAMSRDRRG